MKKVNLMLLGLCVLGLFQACEEDPLCLYCPPSRVCVDGECVLREECFELNNVGVCYDNLYLGVVKGNSCVDTIIFNGTLQLSGEAFPYFVKFDKLGLENRSLLILEKLGENEYFLGDAFPVCGSWAGEFWYFSRIHCKIYPDSVRMNIFFRSSQQDFDDESFIDSCKVTLYKKAFLPK